MWFESEGPSYVMLISVLLILAAFALLVFGTLPCSCKYIFMLKQICFWRHQRTRVSPPSTNSNRTRHEVEAPLPQYPGNQVDPFSLPNDISIGSLSHDGMESSSRSPGLTFVTLTTANLHYSLPLSSGSVLSLGPGQRSIEKSDWDELPPSYDSLFPVPKHKQKQKSPSTTVL